MGELWFSLPVRWKEVKHGGLNSSFFLVVGLQGGAEVWTAAEVYHNGRHWTATTPLRNIGQPIYGSPEDARASIEAELSVIDAF